jgi:inosine-uridine nucleoside N-ribohydrolase
MGRSVALMLVVPAIWAGGRETIIVDTDSGLFGDDGAAVVMLLRSPAQVAVSGITIVPGNVWPGEGAADMLHILDLLGRPDVAVYRGAEEPLVHTAAMAREYERRWGPLEFTGAFAKSPHPAARGRGNPGSPRRPRHENAVNYLISEIERHPGELTILEIGPMTNLALALRMKPDIETKIKRLVFMGGNVRVGGNASALAEFNFWFDAEAARIVLRSRIAEKVMFGLDICNQAPIHKAEFDRIANVHTPIADLFREDLGERYPAFLRQPAATAYLWDSLAAAYLVDPGFVTRSEMRYLDVETAWGKFYGSTKPLDRRVAPDATPVTLMLGLNFPRVFELYRELLTRKN